MFDKTTDGNLVKKMFGLCKRSRTTKLMTVLNVEPMERVLVKRKLNKYNYYYKFD